jgi:hypothetical protein
MKWERFFLFFYFVKIHAKKQMSSKINKGIGSFYE